MAEFDIQVQVPVLLRAVAAGLRSRKICPPPPFEVAGVSLTVQQVEFTGNELRHSKPGRFAVFYESHGLSYGLSADGFQTQLAQDVLVHVTTTEDVLSHPNDPPGRVLAVPLTVVVDLDYFVGNETSTSPGRGVPVVRGTLADVEWPENLPLPPSVDREAVLREAEALIRRAFPSFTRPLDIPNLLMGGAAVALNAGMTVSADGTVLVFRAETGAGSSSVDVRWRNFFSGSVTNRLAGAECGLWIERRIVESIFQNAVWQAVAAEAPPEIDLISVGSEYSVAGGKARVTTTVRAHVDLPDPLGNPYVEVPIRTEFSVTPDRALAMDVWLPDVQSIARSIIAFVDFVLRRLLGPIWELIGVSLDSNIADIESPTSGLSTAGFQCTVVEPLHQRCTRRLPPSSFAGAQVRISGLVAQPDGMLLAAELQAPVLTPATLETSFRQFAWTPPHVSCGSADIALAAAFAESAEELAPLQAKIFLEADGSTPAWFCSLEVLNDPLNRFPAEAIQIDTTLLPSVLTVRVPNPGPAYAASPYPVDVLVRTTLGSRLIRIPPGPALTEKDIIRLKAVMIGAIANCKLLTRRGPFDLRWIVDPPQNKRFVQRWQVTAERLHPGTPVKLLTGGRPLVTVQARPSVATRLSALVRSGTGGGLRLVRDDLLGSSAQATLSIRQQVLEATASVPVDARIASVLTSPVWAPNGVVAVVADGLAAYDLANAARPRTVGRWYIDGVRRALNWPSGLLVVTEDGFLSIDAERRITRVGPAVEPSPVLDAAFAHGVVHVLTADALQVRSHGLVPRSSTAAAGARSLLRLGGRLLVGGPSGIAVHRLSRTGRTGDAVVSLPELDITRLEAVTVDDEAAVVATLAEGTFRALSVDERDQVSVVAEYPERPWFAGATRLRDTYVLVDDRGMSLEVLRAGTSQPVGADATTELPDGFAFASWNEIGEERAVGTLHGAELTVEGPLGTGGVTDGTFPLFAAAHFSPPLPASDAVNLISLAGSSFRVLFNAPVRDVVLHLASVASRIDFPPGTPVARISGDPTFSLSGTTVTGVVAGSLDSGGTLRIYGTVTELRFTAIPVFADGTSPDGFYLQIGGITG